MNAVHRGFMLGVRVAEQLNNLPQNCTVQNPGFLDFLRGIVNGSITVVESAAELNLPPDAGPAQEERRLANEAMRTAAMEVIFLCNPAFPRQPDRLGDE